MAVTCCKIFSKGHLININKNCFLLSLVTWYEWRSYNSQLGQPHIDSYVQAPACKFHHHRHQLLSSASSSAVRSSMSTHEKTHKIFNPGFVGVALGDLGAQILHSTGNGMPWAESGFSHYATRTLANSGEESLHHLLAIVWNGLDLEMQDWIENGLRHQEEALVLACSCSCFCDAIITSSFAIVVFSQHNQIKLLSISYNHSSHKIYTFRGKMPFKKWLLAIIHIRNLRRQATLHQHASAATTRAHIANLLELVSTHLAQRHKDLCVPVGAAIRAQNLLKARTLLGPCLAPCFHDIQRLLGLWIKKTSLHLDRHWMIPSKAKDEMQVGAANCVWTDTE